MTVEERFWAKVDRSDESGCWLWTAGQFRGGYGRFAINRRSFISAHRFAYELLIGPIPGGLQLDHLCRVRGCVNPAHLEPVTNAVNTQRGLSPLASAIRQRAKTHCVHGHEFTPENTGLRATRNGRLHRVCRTCAREYMRDVRARRISDGAPRGTVVADPAESASQPARRSPSPAAVPTSRK